MGQSLQPQPAEADSFLGERRIHFQQQRHAAAPCRPASGNMEKVSALIDDIRAEGPRRARQPHCGDQPIGHLRQLAQCAGQQAADAREGRALAAQCHGIIGRRPDDADLVSGSAQRGDQRLDMHALPVMGLDAMAVEDTHARTPSVAPATPPSSRRANKLVARWPRRGVRTAGAGKSSGGSRRNNDCGGEAEPRAINRPQHGSPLPCVAPFPACH